MLRLWHDGASDDDIEAEMCLNKDARIRLENLIVPKVAAAVLYAISFAASHEKPA